MSTCHLNSQLRCQKPRILPREVDLNCRNSHDSLRKMNLKKFYENIGYVWICHKSSHKDSNIQRFSTFRFLSERHREIASLKWDWDHPSATKSPLATENMHVQNSKAASFRYMFIHIHLGLAAYRHQTASNRVLTTRSCPFNVFTTPRQRSGTLPAPTQGAVAAPRSLLWRSPSLKASKRSRTSWEKGMGRSKDIWRVGSIGMLVGNYWDVSREYLNILWIIGMLVGNYWDRKNYWAHLPISDFYNWELKDGVLISNQVNQNVG